MDKLKGAEYFTKLNIQWGYNNIRIKEGDEWKAAFRMNRGLFEPLVMFFGLTYSPATFQNMMNGLLRGLVDRGKVIIYIDNIMIFTIGIEEHQQVVQEVLQILKDNQLFLKAEKCIFKVLEVEYLGLPVSKGQVCMDPIKVKGIVDWLKPKNKKDIQLFLGFANFYQ